MECSTPHSSTEKTLLPNHDKPMKNLQDFVFKLAQAHPNAPLAPSAKALLRDRFHRFVSDYRTPDHPPYSAMIQNALEELKEKGGSKEESISHYLEKKYDNLPYAHSPLLKHHLEKMHASGDIEVTRANKYRLAGSLGSTVKTIEPQPRKLRSESKKPKHKNVKIRSSKKRNQRSSKKVERVKKHQEYDEIETENGDNGFPADAIILLDERREIGELEHEQYEFLSPERPPVLESVRVENLGQSCEEELELTRREMQCRCIGPGAADCSPEVCLRSQGGPLKLRIRIRSPAEPIKDVPMDGLEENVVVVDDCGEEGIKKSRNFDECSSVNEEIMQRSMVVLITDDPEPHQKGLKRKRVGRPPKRRSARLQKMK